MNRIFGAGLIIWMNLLLVFLIVFTNVSFLDVFRFERIFDTSLLVYGIIIGAIIYIIIIMNIYFTRGLRKEYKIPFVIFSNCFPGYFYSVMISSISGIILVTCYTLSIIWILREREDGQKKGKIWHVMMFGWNAQNKMTNLLMLGITLAGLCTVNTNPQPYINEFKNMSLSMVQVNIGSTSANQTFEEFLPMIEKYIEESLPPIMNKSEIKEKILENQCGDNQTCREILLSYSNLDEIVNQTYEKQIKDRELWKKQAIEQWKEQVQKQLQLQNSKTKEFLETMMMQIPLIKIMLENIHWIVALTASAVVIIYGKLILGPVFVLLSLMFYKVLSQRDSWEELVEFIQVRFR